MSETFAIFLMSLAMIGVTTTGLIWYAIVAARKEERDSRQESAPTRRLAGRMVSHLDPDAHLGHSGTE